MLDTVPSSVTLSDVVAPRPWIVQEGLLDISTTGTVFFVGSFTFHSLANVVPTSAVYEYTIDGGVSTGTLSTGVGGMYHSRNLPGFDLGFEYILIILSASSVKHGYGTLTKFQFNDTISNPAITGLNLADGVYTTSISLNMFIIRGQTFLGGSISGGLKYIVRAAVRTHFLPPHSHIPSLSLFIPPSS